VLDGAASTIGKFKPQLLVEVLKTPADSVVGRLQRQGYRVYPMGMNVLAIHADDPVSARVSLEDGNLRLS
jgi:hypothetical protein